MSEKLPIGTVVIHAAYGNARRKVTAHLEDGRYELSTRDERTKSGVRKTRVSPKTLRREYVVVNHAE
jgi:hypothetical protein